MSDVSVTPPINDAMQSYSLLCAFEKRHLARQLQQNFAARLVNGWIILIKFNLIFREGVLMRWPHTSPKLAALA